MTDDLPVDLQQVTADDEAIERLRSRSVTPDPALVLLRALLADVDTDLPSSRPVGRGSTVLTLAGEQPPERRLARNGTVVALFTAGIVSFGSVAAASVLVPPGNPLHGIGEAVRSVATAVAPPKEARRDAGDRAGRAAGSGAVARRPVPPMAPPELPAAARVSSLPGAAISTAARSRAADRQAAAAQVAAREAAAGRAAEAAEPRPAPKGGSGAAKSSSRRAPTEQPPDVAPEKATRPVPAVPGAGRRVLPLGKPQLSRTASMKPRA